MKKAILVATTIALALTGCASTNTGIVQISEGTYMYAKQDWTAYSGGVVKAELYKEANAFCAGKGICNTRSTPSIRCGGGGTEVYIIKK